MISTHGISMTSAHCARMGEAECRQIHLATLEVLERVGGTSMMTGRVRSWPGAEPGSMVSGFEFRNIWLKMPCAKPRAA
ncbi:hypothetical protein D1BOALGB6SA_3415 [Olavius sp. associated proteobacterium Delta 1]|nr:hypothetical protein D1BOALGB6SA_3415 [Olavius sp. associated proteobacterium Delta 1]